jgi:DnaJ-class molecular chaperone
MQNRRNYYRVLHVQPDAPAETIAASYKTLMQGLRMHPDLGGDHRTAVLINEAFATLRDPARRRAYDRTLVLPFRQRRSETPATPSSVAVTSPADVGSMTCAFCRTPHAVSALSQSDALCASCRSPLCPVVRHDPRDDAASRAVERIRRRIPVEFHVAWPSKTALQGTSEDVSGQGMSLIVAVELAVGQRVKIECELCDAVGVVVRISRFAGLFATEWQVGLKFLTCRLRQF